MIPFIEKFLLHGHNQLNLPKIEAHSAGYRKYPSANPLISQAMKGRGTALGLVKTNDGGESRRD